MKIKQPIYLIAGLAGIILLFAGPSVVGTEIGLAMGFVLLFFGLYGISRRVSDAVEDPISDDPPEDSDHGIPSHSDPKETPDA